VEGLGTVDDFPGITEALAKRSFAQEDIRKILGANFLRVFEEVWKK
jgi:membrane dipeptidase